jgi:hypothetical protein
MTDRYWHNPDDTEAGCANDMTASVPNQLVRLRGATSAHSGVSDCGRQRPRDPGGEISPRWTAMATASVRLFVPRRP